jgi:hypothetical protein
MGMVSEKSLQYVWIENISSKFSLNKKNIFIDDK